jgi:aquaporin Z
MEDPVTGPRSEMQTTWTRALLGIHPRWGGDFEDLSKEWRRLFAEVLGTFLLVLAAAGGPAVSTFSHGAISRVAYVSAPGLMVAAVILSIGLISGAHLNPAVTLAFTLRHEFPWKRVPGYLMAQVVGSVLACLLLWALVGKVGLLGATEPGRGVSDLQAMVMEATLTFGLVTVILGTASGAQNVGPLSALAVGGYIALAGLWSSPISGASMNPSRSFGPDLVMGDFSHFWVYVVGPVLGALLAVGAAQVLRGAGGDATAERAAQGTLNPPSR